MLIEPSFKNQFSKMIIEYVSKTNSTYMDAILKYCADYNIEPEGAAKLLSKPIIEKLVEEEEIFISYPKRLNFPFDIKGSMSIIHKLGRGSSSGNKGDFYVI